MLRSLNIARWVAQSADPDQMPHSAVCDLVFTVCSGLSVSILRVIWYCSNKDGIYTCCSRVMTVWTLMVPCSQGSAIPTEPGRKKPAANVWRQRLKVIKKLINGKNCEEKKKREKNPHKLKWIKMWNGNALPLLRRADNSQKLTKFAHKWSQTSYPQYQCTYQVWLKSPGNEYKYMYGHKTDGQLCLTKITHSFYYTITATIL